MIRKTRIPKGLSARELDDLCNWLRANDIEPNDIPLDSDIIIRRWVFGPGTITVTRYLRINGRMVRDVFHPNEVKKVSQTVPLKVAWEGRTDG